MDYYRQDLPIFNLDSQDSYLPNDYAPHTYTDPTMRHPPEAVSVALEGARTAQQHVGEQLAENPPAHGQWRARGIPPSKVA